MSSRTPPREIRPGVFWLGGCIEIPYGDEILHGYHSCYVIAGSRVALLVDTGHPMDWDDIQRQWEGLVREGLPELDYIFVTHGEIPHAGNLRRWLTVYPDPLIVGDTRDLHLVAPDHVDRIVDTPAGTTIDLGDRDVQVIAAPIRDLRTSLWLYDETAGVVFTSDGFAYMHHHRPHECWAMAEEIDDLPISDYAALFAAYALYWTRHTDLRPVKREIEQALASLPHLTAIAPGHGCPIGDPATTVPEVLSGLDKGAIATID